MIRLYKIDISPNIKAYISIDAPQLTAHQVTLKLNEETRDKLLDWVSERIMFNTDNTVKMAMSLKEVEIETDENGEYHDIQARFFTVKHLDAHPFAVELVADDVPISVTLSKRTVDVTFDAYRYTKTIPIIELQSSVKLSGAGSVLIEGLSDRIINKLLKQHPYAEPQVLVLDDVDDCPFEVESDPDWVNPKNSEDKTLLEDLNLIMPFLR